VSDMPGERISDEGRPVSRPPSGLFSKTSVFQGSAASFQSAEPALRFSSGGYFRAMSQVNARNGRHCGPETVLFRPYISCTPVCDGK
jgi:hypothetical protein